MSTVDTFLMRTHFFSRKPLNDFRGNKGFQVKSFSIPFFSEVSLMAQLKTKFQVGTLKEKQDSTITS